MNSTPNRMPTSFNALNRLHPLRPISDAHELEKAMNIIDRLSGRTDRTQDQTDYLESLGVLVRDYEADRFVIDDVGDWPVSERLQELCDNRGMSASDLGELLGNRSLGSKLVRGEREPSKAHIRVLSEHFKVNAGYFI